MKKCPYCAEEIQENAIICRFCNSNLTDDKITANINLLRIFKNVFLILGLLLFFVSIYGWNRFEVIDYFKVLGLAIGSFVLGILFGVMNYFRDAFRGPD